MQNGKLFYYDHFYTVRNNVETIPFYGSYIMIILCVGIIYVLNSDYIIASSQFVDSGNFQT